MGSTHKLAIGIVGRIGTRRAVAQEVPRWTPQEVLVVKEARDEPVVAADFAPLPRRRWTSTASSCSSDSIGALCAEVVEDRAK